MLFVNKLMIRVPYFHAYSKHSIIFSCLLGRLGEGKRAGDNQLVNQLAKESETEEKQREEFILRNRKSFAESEGT